MMRAKMRAVVFTLKEKPRERQSPLAKEKGSHCHLRQVLLPMCLKRRPLVMSWPLQVVASPVATSIMVFANAFSVAIRKVRTRHRPLRGLLRSRVMRGLLKFLNFTFGRHRDGDEFGCIGSHLCSED